MTARQTLAVVLAVVAAFSAVAGAASWYLRDGVVQREAFADRAVRALDREPVRRAVGDEISAQVLDRLPAGIVSQARVESTVRRLVDTSAFRRAFRRGALDVNDALFAHDRADATLSVDVSGVLAAAAPQLAAVLPAGGTAQLLTLRRSDLPVDTARAGDVVSTLAVLLPALACFALAGALTVAADRRRALRVAGLAAALGGVLLFAAVTIGRALAVDAALAGDGVARAQARAATGAAWDVYAGGLRAIAFVALAAGLVIAVLTLVPWGGREAPDARPQGARSRR